MRYRGKFQRAKYPIIQVDPSDEGEVLEEKWKMWVEREQWKRFVLPRCGQRELLLICAFLQTCLSLLPPGSTNINDHVDESLFIVFGTDTPLA